MTASRSTPRRAARRVTVASPEDRAVLRQAAVIISVASGLFRSSMLEPYSTSTPRTLVWPERTHQDRLAKRDYDDALAIHKGLLRIANRRPA